MRRESANPFDMRIQTSAARQCTRSALVEAPRTRDSRSTCDLRGTDDVRDASGAGPPTNVLEAMQTMQETFKSEGGLNGV